MTAIVPLDAAVTAGPEAIGGKAHGLITLRRLGLPTPPGFVIPAALGRGDPPPGFDADLDAALDALEAASARETGGGRPVSVRSGAAVSMPGMMETLLGVGRERVRAAIHEVFGSWGSPRAHTYRELHGIPHGLGTSVTVQTMVFGDADEHSGSGVAFSRSPIDGRPFPYGEVLFGHSGDHVVSGRAMTDPLDALAAREPQAWAVLLDAMARLETHYRDACYLEFTVESGRLWLLQARPARLPGPAGARVAVDLAETGAIDRSEAVRRVPPDSVPPVPRLATDEACEVLARGLGASPGVAYGRVAVTADDAVRMAADGPVVLVRPETSPLDLHGMAAAAGIVTARGGPASHAAVVARSLGRPAVVGVGVLRAGEGTPIALDGTAGIVLAGRPRTVATADDPSLRRLREWAGSESAEG